MSGLLFLTAQDFNIQRGSRGPIMCHGISNYSLIMFYSTQCSHCQTLIPIFKKLPGTVGHCQFGMVNVGANRKCVEMSKQTIVPIEYVPLIILYINGKPFMRYPKNYAYTMENLQKFVVDIANYTTKKQQFSKEKMKGGNQNEVPEYLVDIGVPLCGDDKVCYLEYDGAYDK